MRARLAVPVTRWVMETARMRSIKAHAAAIRVPPGLDDPAKLQMGVEHFAAHCAVCHGALCVPRGEIAEGLYPQPPNLARAAPLSSDAELFWIVKHGIENGFYCATLSAVHVVVSLQGRVIHLARELRGNQCLEDALAAT